MLLQLALVLMTLIAAPTKQEEVEKIDRRISQLEDLQRRLRSSAEHNINNALRWQFQNQNRTDARRAWDRAAQEKQKIRELQDQIDGLRQRREQILKEHGTSTP